MTIILHKDGLVNYYVKILAYQEEFAGVKFNSCLLNLYHNGNESMGWHSDDEKSLGKDNTIASLSFGAERKFLFKQKQTKQIISLVLEHGSLLIMKDATQKIGYIAYPNHSPTQN
jgi:alkylated DNA repair dioxygenase AlkB